MRQTLDIAVGGSGELAHGAGLERAALMLATIAGSLALVGTVLFVAAPDSAGIRIPAPVDAGLPQSLVFIAPVLALAGVALGVAVAVRWKGAGRLVALMANLIAFVVTTACMLRFLAG